MMFIYATESSKHTNVQPGDDRLYHSWHQCVEHRGTTTLLSPLTSLSPELSDRRLCGLSLGSWHGSHRAASAALRHSHSDGHTEHGRCDLEQMDLLHHNSQVKSHYVTQLITV